MGGKGEEEGGIGGGGGGGGGENLLHSIFCKIGWGQKKTLCLDPVTLLHKASVSG